MPTFERLPEGAPAIRGEIEAYQPVPEVTTAAQDPEALKRKPIHGYYAGISYADAHIGKVLDELDRSGLASNTVVVLLGDHGYYPGDHAMWTKHTNYEQARTFRSYSQAPASRPARRRANWPRPSTSVRPLPSLPAWRHLKCHSRSTA